MSAMFRRVKTAGNDEVEGAVSGLAKLTLDDEPAAAQESKGVTDNEPFSFLNKVVFDILGTPDSSITKGDAKARAQRRGAAGQLSKSAESNPGEAFMGSPAAGSSGFGLQDIISMFTKPSQDKAAGGDRGDLSQAEIPEETADVAGPPNATAESNNHFKIDTSPADKSDGIKDVSKLLPQIFKALAGGG